MLFINENKIIGFRSDFNHTLYLIYRCFFTLSMAMKESINNKWFLDESDFLCIFLKLIQFQIKVSTNYTGYS